jgi:hypothetical protein
MEEAFVHFPSFRASFGDSQALQNINSKSSKKFKKVQRSSKKFKEVQRSSKKFKSQSFH